jgi:hypothetical protein
MVSLEFFIDIILPAAIWPRVVSASNKYQGISWEAKAAFIYRLSRNFGILKILEP